MLNHTKYGIQSFLNRKPLCFLALLCALRDMAIGLGYVTHSGNIKKTLLYQNYDEIAPGRAGWYVGFLFIIVGLLTAIPILLERMKWTRTVLRVSAMLWLFAVIMYALYGEWALAIYLAGFMTIVSGYLAYYFKFAPVWNKQGKLLRDSFIKEHDPLTHITDRARIERKGEIDSG